MFKRLLVLIMVGLAAGLSAAQIEFDFSMDAVGEPPPGFVSLISGSGRPADWKVTEEQVPPLLAPLVPTVQNYTAKRAVLSVQSFNLDRDHYPILLYTNEILTDFTLTTRFKIGGGISAPCAGVVFRAQDESNYYVVRASAEGNLLWYRVVNGEPLLQYGIGIKTPIQKDTWRELQVECQGSLIRCFLDGKLVIPPVQAGAPTNGLAINDTTFPRGKVGFWTRADTKCSFVDANVTYTPHVPYVQLVIDSIVKQYPSLLSVKVYANVNPGLPSIIGAMDPKLTGKPGTKTEADVIAQGSIYFLKVDKTVEVTMPLRDRNGDIVAAIAIKFKSFPGELDKTAVERATTVKKAFEDQIANMEDLKS